ncbi:MAG: hypothetical protein IJE01_01170 [Clostridia bacterium]|nr:hypothetical protein [Clostridia bacterium]
MKVRGFLKKHRNFVKAVCVVVVSALLLGIFPADVFSGFVTNTQAAYVPVYDPALGSYTVDGSTLTAIPADSCGFRGWYKDGKEVSASKTFTMPTGGSKDDYTPVFYNFNLIENGGFEGSTPGVDLKKDVYDDNIWYGYTSGENDWTKAVVSNDKANSGNNSARFYSRNNTIYRNITGLEANTQYTLSFYYNIANLVTDSDGNTSNPYLKYAVILPKNTEFNPANNHLSENFADVYFADASTGGCAEGEWKQVTLSFFTNDTTDFILAFTYIANVDTYLYIDDLSLIKDELAAPTYANDDFSTQSVANWSVPSKNFAISYKNGRLETQAPTDNYGVLVSAPFWVNKGREYKVSFKLDLSDVDNYMREIKNGTFVTDENGNPVYLSGSYNDKSPNFFCFYVGKAAGKSLNVNSKILVKNGETTNQDLERTTTKYESWPAYYGGGTVDKHNPENVKNLTCTMTFTAPESEVLYFSTKLNGYGTYAIDDFKVEKTKESDIAVEEAIKHSLKTIGTAIRTTGNQGIRHKTEVDKRLLCDEGYFGIRVKEYGTVAMRNNILNGAELTVNNGVVGKAYSLADNKDVRFEETNTGIQYTGVLINISENYWNTDFTMRGYIKYDFNGEEKIIYTDPIDSSIYLVSKFAYSAKTPTGEFAESDKIRDYLYTTILSKYRDKAITINDEEVTYTNFQGISSTIYHCSSVVDDGVHNRTYTTEQLEIEMDRLKDSGIDNVRTLFRSRWAWDNNIGGWNWESENMKAIYEWAKMLGRRGITITINAGWHLEDYTAYADYHYFDEDGDGIVQDIEKDYSSISEVEYLKNVTGMADKYNEQTNRGVDVDLSDGVTKEEYYAVVSARYGEWITQAVKAFKDHGVNNVKYILPFTESSHFNGDVTAVNAYWEWLVMTMGLHDTLVAAGTREDYKIIGPSQSINIDQGRKLSMVEYYSLMVDEATSAQCIADWDPNGWAANYPAMFENGKKYTDYKDMVDILSSHHYPKPDTASGYEDTIYDPYACYSWADKNFDYFEALRNNSEKNADGSNKEFLADEFFTYASDAVRREDIGLQMTQFSACLSKGINTGINRFLSWQIFDTLWDKQTNTGGEFIGGVHACGTAPSLIDTSNCTSSKGENCPCHDYDKYVSETPRKLYYGLNLLGKHLQNKNASVVSSAVEDIDNYDANGGLYVSSIINDENRLVVLVANTTNRPTNFNLNLESGFEAKFTRYTYNPDGITPTKEAKSIPSDGYITSTEGNFYDTLAPGSFAFYISEIRDLGDDVIIDMGGLMP